MKLFNFQSFFFCKYENCNAAAFYMGTFSHYIADVSSFTHVIDMAISEHMYYEKKLAQRIDNTASQTASAYDET
ncbi:MAG: zinc dependent phospholipase C family protein [Promethearchaeota archaeon]